MGKEEASRYRELVARANFLSMDRPDIAFAVKELCRSMSSPTRRDAEALKRLSRYLHGRPRVILAFPWQDAEDITVFTDSDWSGCLSTRRSTSGGALMRGNHLLRHWSSTQQTVALSSAEAELISIVKGTSEGIGARSLLRDVGRDAAVRVRADASAAIGMARRAGVGRVRHLDTRILWIQDRVRTGDVALGKVAGLENPADLFTKYLPIEAASRHCERLGCASREGRAASAPVVVGCMLPEALVTRKVPSEEGCRKAPASSVRCASQIAPQHSECIARP